MRTGSNDLKQALSVVLDQTCTMIIFGLYTDNLHFTDTLYSIASDTNRIFDVNSSEVLLKHLKVWDLTGSQKKQFLSLKPFIDGFTLELRVIVVLQQPKCYDNRTIRHAV